MDGDFVGTLALGLPEAVEAPHFGMRSFRVRGKIFATLTPDGMCAHFFVPEEQRNQARAVFPDVVEPLYWGARVCGLRVPLRAEAEEAIRELVRAAWRAKAPKRLVDEFDAARGGR